MITITTAVGERCKPNAQDLAAIEMGLRKAGMLPAIGPIHEQGLVQAIRTFQKAMGSHSPDGRIDPGGNSLRKLNAILQPLQITSITPSSISGGGYTIKVSPFVPGAPYKVLFGFSQLEADCIDVTGRPSGDLLDKARLVKLLEIIKRLGRWAAPALVKLYVKLESQTISESAPGTLPCPVQPHNGKLLPLDEANNGATLKYLGDSAKGPFYGRMLEEVLPGMFVFKYGGVLETDPTKRGFDCITYAGTVCGASTSHMAEAADMASHLGATTVSFEVDKKTVTLENADPSVVKKFFESDRPDRYLMWSGGHVVLVDNKTVHEFAYSKQGYAATAVATWLEPYKTVKLTVRKV